MARKNSLQYDLQHSPVFKGIKNNNTVKQYKRQLVPFAAWCKENGIKHMDDLQKLDSVEVLQTYADFLAAQGGSASTIHARLAATCRVLKVNMGDIHKPKRLTALNRRSRRFKRDYNINVQGKREESQIAYKRLVDFQKRVGIRRAELSALSGNDFRMDESGYWCVYVRKGKGGKQQLQRLLPEDVDFCRNYFMAAGKEKLFSKAEMSNHIDLHGLRALQAQKAYKYYSKRLKEDPDYRQKLRVEMIMRFEQYNKDPQKKARFIKTLTKENRVCRGENAAIAEKLYGSKEMDMTAIMAVSVFHLSHWRDDVTVLNYLLSIRV